MTMPKVFLGTPCNWEHIPLHYHVSLMLMDKKPMTHYAIANRGSKAEMRNMLVKMFLNTDATHLMTCDVDGRIPEDAMMLLVKLDLPIVSLIHAGRKPPFPKSVFMERVRPFISHALQEPIYGLTQVYATGFPAVMFKREIFEQLKYPYFDLKYLTTLDECDEVDIGRRVTTDLYFCEMCYRANIPVYVYPKFVPHISEGLVNIKGMEQQPIFEPS